MSHSLCTQTIWKLKRTTSLQAELLLLMKVSCYELGKTDFKMGLIQLLPLHVTDNYRLPLSLLLVLP